MEVKGISAIKNTSLIRLHGKLTRNIASVNSRTYNAMARNGIPVFLLAQHPDTDDFSFAVAGNDANEALKVLNEEFAPELINSELDFVSISENKATVAIVGDNIREDSRLAVEIFSQLEKNGFEIEAASKGTSQTTISFVIDAESSDDAMKLIHSLLFN